MSTLAKLLAGGVRQNRAFAVMCEMRQAKSIHVKVKVKFTLEQTMKAQKWSRGIALLCL